MLFSLSFESVSSTRCASRDVLLGYGSFIEFGKEVMTEKLYSVALNAAKKTWMVILSFSSQWNDWNVRSYVCYTMCERLLKEKGTFWQKMCKIISLDPSIKIGIIG